MSGTQIGGYKARDKNKQLYGKDFYGDIGRAGGKKSSGGPFTDPEFAREAGKIGGKIGKRGKAKPISLLRQMNAAKARRDYHGRFAPEYSFGGTYGSLEAPETVEAIKEMTEVRYVQQYVPGWLYGVWVVGSILAIFGSFWLGSIAYR